MVPNCGSLAVFKTRLGHVGEDAVVEGLTVTDGNGTTENCDDTRHVNIGRYEKKDSLHLACDAKSFATRYPVHSSYKSNNVERLFCAKSEIQTELKNCRPYYIMNP